MYLEKQVKERIKFPNSTTEEPLVTDCFYHMGELNAAFFDRRVFLSQTTPKEREAMTPPLKIPAYVHAEAVKIYAEAFNSVREALKEDGRVDLGKYGHLVLRLAERMDFGGSVNAREILNAQEYYTSIMHQMKKLTGR